MVQALMPRHFHHAAFRCQVAFQDYQAAGGLERVDQGPDHVLARRLDRSRRFCT